MIPDGVPFLKHLPPKTIGALRQAINVCGDMMGMAPDWVQRWVAFTLVAGALTRRSANTPPSFEVKGGAAIELRLRPLVTGSVPRASKDLDATFRGALDEIEEAVRAVLVGDQQGFTFRVVLDGDTLRHIRRFEVAVSYLGRNFSRVKLETSAYEGVDRGTEEVPAPSLAAFGFEGPETLPCLPMAKQVAQKLHAVTEVPGDGRTNDRFRDLVDLVMLRAVEPPSPRLREICEETFSVRGMHQWPPSLVVYPRWVEPLERLAREVALTRVDASEIGAEVADYIQEIAGA